MFASWNAQPRGRTKHTIVVARNQIVLVIVLFKVKPFNDEATFGVHLSITCTGTVRIPLALCIIMGSWYPCCIY